MTFAATPDTKFPLLQTALDWLQRGSNEKYELRLHGERAIKLGLDALFNSGVPPKEPIELLLGLASTLDHKWNSPTAAGLIIGVVCDDQRARKLCGIGDKNGGRVFFDGTKTNIVAPMYGEDGTKGSVSIRDLVEPSKLRPGGRIR